MTRKNGNTWWSDSERIKSRTRDEIVREWSYHKTEPDHPGPMASYSFEACPDGTIQRSLGTCRWEITEGHLVQCSKNGLWANRTDGPLCLWKGSSTFPDKTQHYQSVGERENRKVLDKTQVCYWSLYSEEGHCHRVLQFQSESCASMRSPAFGYHTEAILRRQQTQQQFQKFVLGKSWFFKKVL
jgi:hypothetical protein